MYYFRHELCPSTYDFGRHPWGDMFRKKHTRIYLLPATVIIKYMKARHIQHSNGLTISRPTFGRGMPPPILLCSSWLAGPRDEQYLDPNVQPLPWHDADSSFSIAKRWKFHSHIPVRSLEREKTWKGKPGESEKKHANNNQNQEKSGTRTEKGNNSGSTANHFVISLHKNFLNLIHMLMFIINKPVTT